MKLEAEEEEETMAVVAAIEEAAAAAEVAVGIAIRGDSHFAAIARGSQGKRRKNRMY